MSLDFLQCWKYLLKLYIAFCFVCGSIMLCISTNNCHTFLNRLYLLSYYRALVPSSHTASYPVKCCGFRNRNKRNSMYSLAPNNDVSVNDGPHIRRWSHNIIILTIVLQLPTVFSTVTCCTSL